MGRVRRGLTGDLGPHVQSVLSYHEVSVRYRPLVSITTGRPFAYDALFQVRHDEVTSIEALQELASSQQILGELGRLLRSQALSSGPDTAIILRFHPEELNEGWMTRPDDPMFSHPHPVFLELPESLPVSHGLPSLGTLRELRDKGTKLVVDQFGGGLSNLKYIADLEPVLVKLDPSFNRALLGSEAHRKLVKGIVRLVQDLGAAVAAVDVQSLRELDALAEVGVSYVEGDFVGRPSLTPVNDASAPSWPAKTGDE